MARKSRYARPSSAKPSAVGHKRYRVAIYLRLSVDDGDSLESNSIGNQRKLCLAFLERHEDLELGSIYVDDGYSGMNYKRPGIQSMLSDLRTQKVNCVVVKDVSRLGRHYVMTSEYVEKIFPEMGVRLICINDDFDSDDPSSDHKGLLMPFKLIMNDTYVKDTSRRIRSSIHAKMEKGEFLPPVGSVPYGYLRAPEQGSYVIDLETAPVVQRIYEMRSRGMAFNNIARCLNQEGILSPGKLRFERGVCKAEKFKDSLWVRGTIRKITSDSVYIGDRTHGKVGCDRLGGDKKKRPKEAWQVISAAHPAIITQELFDQVQKINQAKLERRATYEKRGSPLLDYREIFRGKVICGDCGAKMTSGIVFDGDTPVSVNYDCNRYRDTCHLRCSTHYIRQEVLMETLKHCLDKQVEAIADVERLITEAREMTDSPSGIKSRLAGLRVQRLNIDSKIERLLEDVTQEIIDKDEYLQIKAKYRREQELICYEEESALREYEELKSTMSTAETWLTKIRRYQELPKIDRKIFDALVDEMQVFESGEIHFKLTYGDPFKMLKAYLTSSKGAACHA